MALHGTDPLIGYLEYLHRAYGDDLHRPDFGFIARAAQSQPYGALIEHMRAMAKVYELSNWNDDVAYCFRLEFPSSEKMLLWLSAVGPFAMLHCAIYDPRPLERQDLATERQPTRHEAEVIDLVSSAGFRFPSLEDLMTAVDFAPINDTGPVPLVRLLFSDNADFWPERRATGLA